MGAPLARRAAALAVVLAVIVPQSARADDAALLEQVRELGERVERLERQNRELEKRLEAMQSTESRVNALEQAQAQTEKALATERLSEAEPELVTRLKAIEFQTLNMQKQVREIDSLEGITVSASLVGVGQGVNGAGAASGESESRLNYRGDVGVALPGGEMGDVEGKIFTHFRFGQGSGVSLRPTYTSTPNTTEFQAAANPADAYAIVAEAWYQLAVPLPFGGFKPQSRERLELTAGKIDPFAFFDQNAVAGDEATQFLNNVFVHNPLLDSGGDVGVDQYGFSPGGRIAYTNEEDKASTWGASVGVTGSGNGADFTGSFSNPFVIAQLETTRRFAAGQPGTYRAYVWTNGQADNFNGTTGRHSGWGMSIDQRVGDAAALFGRFGYEIQGQGGVRFDRALTLGAQLGGAYWGRAADVAGFAVGFMHTSSAYASATAADGALAGYAASGNETDLELYYRWRLNSRVELSPDLQWIFRPGGNGSAPSAFAGGVRARVGF